MVRKPMNFLNARPTRLFSVLLAATAFDGLERLFANSNPALAWLRSAGLDAVAGLPFVRRQFARRALGLSGDVPRMPV